MFVLDLVLSQSVSNYKTKTVRAVSSQVILIFELDFLFLGYKMSMFMCYANDAIDTFWSRMLLQQSILLSRNYYFLSSKIYLSEVFILGANRLHTGG